MKKKLIEYKIRIVQEFPDEYSENEHIEFMGNGSSYCGDNYLDDDIWPAIKKHIKNYGCLCGYLVRRVIGVREDSEVNSLERVEIYDTDYDIIKNIKEHCDSDMEDSSFRIFIGAILDDTGN